MDGSEEEAILARLAELESEGSRGCSIKDCKNSSYRADVLYFPVPEDPDRRSVWLKLLSEFISESVVGSQLWICSDHFDSKDIIHTNSEPELSPSALPHIQGFTQFEGCEDEEDCTEDWADDHLCFTSTKSVSTVRMDVEASDTPRSLDAFQHLLQESSQEAAEIEHKVSVKMEPRSEAEDDCSSFVDSLSRAETQDASQGESSIFTHPRRVKMNISSDVMEKFLKEGKLEKQSNGSYRVMENVLKEIENSIGGQGAKTSEISTAEKSDLNSQSQDVQGTVPSNRTAVFRRKRGRPRKGTFIPRTAQSQETATSSYYPNSPSSLQLGKTNNKTSTASLLVYDSTEDPGDAESDSEYKPKRKRRSKVLDDYVTDFNTSDEEDVSLTTNFSKFSNRGRGRGRGRKAESLEAFDEDLFTSYVGVFGKKFSLQEDFPDEGMLQEMSDSEEDVPSPSSSSAVKLLNTSKQGSNIKDGLEAVLGQDGRTKIQIVNTGETSVVDNEENLIYHVIATTGKTSTITPLRIPKTAEEPCEIENKDFPSTSQTKFNRDEEGRLDADLELDGSKPKLSSRGRRLRSKQIIRTYNKQVASLRQRYCRALQELRKRPRVYTLADLVYGASRFLTEDQLVFFTLQLKSGCNNMQAIRFSVREKMLALAFYLQSPVLYKWLRVIFHLPTKLILERWLEGIAKSDPDAAKKLMYHVYTRYVFRF
ncbi:uncharacterized protein Dlip2 [Panulirus ornatus]|uniref:uncharacterized protein Dlip2 n=1 Tax=Panulirus ornatus TaxID=150431 RepID=UPI003A866B7B